MLAGIAEHRNITSAVSGIHDSTSVGTADDETFGPSNVVGAHNRESGWVPSTVGVRRDLIHQRTTVTAPLRIERGRIAAEVDLGGHVRLATIDTGASRSFISQDIADVVGQPHQFRDIRTQINLADTSRVEVMRLFLAE